MSIDDLLDSNDPQTAHIVRTIRKRDQARRESMTREQAIEIGRKLGVETAELMHETGTDREERIRRAQAYAAWEYDGKPSSSLSQREEFGVGTLTLTDSLLRPRPEVGK